MAKVTEQTVEIKKSPRSTFGLSVSKKGSARIGDLNMVFHKMLEPSDMIRCQVDTSIMFISPLKVPAFARMKVLTYYFFDSYQNVFDDFNETIQNYEHETKQTIEGGQLITHANHRVPYIMLSELSGYVCRGLHWVPPVTETSTTVPVPPFGDPDSYAAAGIYNRFFGYPMLRNMLFSSYEQKIDIAKLCNQFDVPYGALIPLSKEFQKAAYTNMPNKNVNTDSNFSWNDNVDIKSAIRNLPFTRYWTSPLDATNHYMNFINNAVLSDSVTINILPFKCYQHIFNDWFLDTQKNIEIDLYRSVVHRNSDSSLFTRTSDVSFSDTGTLTYDSFSVRMYTNAENLYMNSIFAIRRPWYAKDYFNVSTNDPTLGVSPYAVGHSILDLRKNSALQRLAEKKALCGNKFVDFIAQHFNYYPPELDISRSIHLSTSVDYVNVSQVLQTSQTSESSPQGERTATAQAYGRSHGVFFKAPTYGEFMVLQCVKPEVDYYEGIPREMQIIDASEYPLPELSQIGFDTISSTELFINPFSRGQFSFGYTPRYSWRKTQQNRIYGELCYTLNYWHQSPSLRFGVHNDFKFGQIGFDTFPLNDTPYRELGVQNPSYNRIFAITDLNEDTYVYQHAINCTLNTCLPTNDSPQL